MQKLIFVNGKMTVNSSYIPKEDEIISVRHKGRFAVSYTHLNAIPTAKNGDTEPVIMFTLVSAAAFKKA